MLLSKLQRVAQPKNQIFMLSIVLYCMASYGTTWNCFVSYRIAQFSVQYGIEWYCIIHSGIAWYCIVGFGVRLVSPKTPIYFKIFMQTNFSEKSYSKDQDPLAYIEYILHLVFVQWKRLHQCVNMPGSSIIIMRQGTSWPAYYLSLYKNIQKYQKLICIISSFGLE